MSAHLVPVLYAIAMGVDALVSPELGRLYDKYGTHTFIASTLISLLFAPLVFLGNFWTAIIGIAMWGLGMSARETLMRATVARLIPAENRAMSYGIFDSSYGLAWFVGSAASRGASPGKNLYKFLLKEYT